MQRKVTSGDLQRRKMIAAAGLVRHGAKLLRAVAAEIRRGNFDLAADHAEEAGRTLDRCANVIEASDLADLR